MNHLCLCSGGASQRMWYKLAVWSEALSLHTCQQHTQCLTVQGWILYTQSGKMKAYFSPQTNYFPAGSTMYTTIFLSQSVSLCPRVEGKKVSFLISKVSLWMWTPCWHIHSTWAIADSSECNLHNYTSSRPVKHKPQTPCCSQQTQHEQKQPD